MLQPLASTSSRAPATTAWCPSAPPRPRHISRRQRQHRQPSSPFSSIPPSSSIPCSAMTSGQPGCSTDHSTERLMWQAPCGTHFEVLQRRSSSGSSSSSSGSKPALVFVHGLYRAAWCWDEVFMPYFAGQEGYDCYAISLRGQGSSELEPGLGGPAGEVPKHHGHKHGVPLATNVADIAAFVGTLPRPPVLVGHSLGGYFVQEYLAQLAQPNSQLPPIAGAALLASATAGKVMAFGEFVADVGLREFCWQMYIVASSAHMRDMSIAHNLWWPQDMPQEDALRYFNAVRSSSHVLPYQTSEVSKWHPPAPEDHSMLPPVLAVGGALDRIIRPFQVRAAEEHWGAKVVVLDDVHHDVMLGPKWKVAADALASWLHEHEEQFSAAKH